MIKYSKKWLIIAIFCSVCPNYPGAQPDSEIVTLLDQVGIFACSVNGEIGLLSFRNDHSGRPSEMIGASEADLVSILDGKVTISRRDLVLVFDGRTLAVDDGESVATGPCRSVSSQLIKILNSL